MASLYKDKFKIDAKKAGKTNTTCVLGYEDFCTDKVMPSYSSIYRTCHLPGTFT